MKLFFRDQGLFLRDQNLLPCREDGCPGKRRVYRTNLSRFKQCLDLLLLFCSRIELRGQERMNLVRLK